MPHDDATRLAEAPTPAGGPAPRSATRSAGRADVGLVVVLGAMAFLPAATTDMYLPSLPQVAEDLHASQAAVQLTISWVLVGGSLGQLVIGPFSDRWGRRRPALWGLAAYVVVALACLAAGSITQLVPLRVLHGVVAAAATVVATAVIGDRWRGADAARLLSRLWLAIAVAPVLAPLLGTVIAEHWGWRAIFAVLAGMGAVLGLVVWRALPETLPPDRRVGAGLGTSLRSYAGVLRDRRFLALALLPGLGLAVIMSYVTGSSFVLQEEYGLSPQTYALVFGLGATSMLVGSQVNAALVARVGPVRLLAVGLPATVASTCALVVVAAGHLGGVVGLLVPLWLTVGLLSGVIANASALALSRHPDRAGTAAAVIGALQGGLGGAVSPLVGFLGGGGVAMGSVMLGAAVIGTVVLAVGTDVLRGRR